MAQSRNRNSKTEKRLIQWLLGFLTAPLGGVFITLLLAGAIVALPTLAVAFAWDRLENLFDDTDWKNAVKAVANYRLPADRENLLLYKSLWVDGKLVLEDDNAHWLNYGKIDSTMYRVPSGPHSYSFDIGREAQVQDIFLLLVCKKCAVSVVYSPDNPRDPDTGQTLDANAVAAYYAPAQHHIDAPDPKRQAAAWSIGQALSGARYITLFVNNADNDAYVAQIMAIPPGLRSNALWAAQPSFDGRYRAIYGSKIIQAVTAPNLIGAGHELLAPAVIHDGNANTISYYQPAADENPQSYLPIYPVVGTGPGQAGDGSAADLAAGYQTIYLGWKLNSYTLGKLDEVGLSWLATYSGAIPPGGSGGSSNNNGSGNGNSSNPLAGLIPPFAKVWRVYLFNSQDEADKAILDSLFNGGSVPPLTTALGSHLAKEITAGTGGTVSIGSLGLPDGDKHDTLVFAFDDSSFLAPATPLTPTSLVGGAIGAGLPLPLLALAEIHLYEKKPPVPQKWPKVATGYTGSTGGAFDLRSGKITAEKIEEIIAEHPWRGIAPGGYQAGEAPSPNKLTGKGAFFIQMGEKYGINPAYAVAFALKETQLGTTGFHVYNASEGKWGYNLYGMTGTGWVEGKCIPSYNGRFCGYASWEDSIEDFFGLLSEAYVQGQGRYLQQDGSGQGQKACPCTTVDRILPWYAPYFENDTALYISQIKEWVTSWGAAGGPTTGGNGGAVPAINQYDVSQYDPPYTDYDTRNSTCGTTSSTMLINWVSGSNLRVIDVLKVQMAHPGSWAGATANFDFLDDLKAQYGFTWHKLTFSSADEYITTLRDLTNQGQPVIANIVGAPYYFGHFFVVVGYNSDDNTFTINDPAAVQQSGNPPGVVQKWSSTKLHDYVQGRLGSYYPAIVISPVGSAPA